jgi:CubicO group peptidase (beta-lactamase class C family)
VTERQLAELLREEARRHRVPGAAIGVLHDGVETLACYGVASTHTAVPVTTASRFGIGSLTKSMVATVVLRLALERRLSLDDPIAAYVPELLSAGWAQRATIRDLLANRSGLPLRAGIEFDFAAAEDDEVLARLAARVAVEKPTTVDWSYSNAGWALAGRAIEIVTGQVWEDAMREILLEPARMHETAFAPGNRVSGHQLTDDAPVPVEPLFARILGPAGATAASTAADMLRFAGLHLADPELAALRERQPSPRIHGWFDAWCLGWAYFDWEGVSAWGWDGLLTGERAVLRLLPERNAAVVLLANGDTGRALFRAVAAELMQQDFDIAVPPLRLDAKGGAADDLTRFAGTYAWPDDRVDVTVHGTSLVLTSAAGETEGVPLGDRVFLVDANDPDNPTVTFGPFDADERSETLYTMLWGLPRVPKC